MVALTGVACSSFTITVLSAALATIANDLDSSVSVVTWVFDILAKYFGEFVTLLNHKKRVNRFNWAFFLYPLISIFPKP